jgi:hypothetical protein
VTTVERHRIRGRLSGVFARIGRVSGDLTLQADFSQYLCVLVSGFLEQMVKQIASERCQRDSTDHVYRYAAAQLGRFRNPNKERILTLVAWFDPSWRTELEEHYESELEAASSIVGNRHRIAHGESVSISYSRVKDYYDRVDLLVAKLEDLFDTRY